MEELQQSLLLALLPAEPEDDGDVILELRSSVGGEWAGGFAADLLEMYRLFAAEHGWKFQVCFVCLWGPGRGIRAGLAYSTWWMLLSTAGASRQGCREGGVVHRSKSACMAAVALHHWSQHNHCSWYHWQHKTTALHPPPHARPACYFYLLLLPLHTLIP
jgi:hypothetical protein